jgi:hypothetical protein
MQEWDCIAQCMVNALKIRRINCLVEQLSIKIVRSLEVTTLITPDKGELSQ